MVKSEWIETETRHDHSQFQRPARSLSLSFSRSDKSPRRVRGTSTVTPEGKLETCALTRQGWDPKRGETHMCTRFGNYDCPGARSE